MKRGEPQWIMNATEDALIADARIGQQIKTPMKTSEMTARIYKVKKIGYFPKT